jgi:hypothetical protein
MCAASRYYGFTAPPKSAFFRSNFEGTTHRSLTRSGIFFARISPRYSSRCSGLASFEASLQAKKDRVVELERDAARHDYLLGIRDDLPGTGRRLPRGAYVITLSS